MRWLTASHSARMGRASDSSIVDVQARALIERENPRAVAAVCSAAGARGSSRLPASISRTAWLPAVRWSERT